MKSKTNKYPSKIFFSFVCCIGVNSLWAADLSITRLGNYVIPAAFSQALKHGMSVPLFLHYKDDFSQDNDQKIADVLIGLDSGGLIIRDITLVDMAEGAQLSVKTIELLKDIKSQHFSSGTFINVSQDAILQLNVKSFNLKLTVNRQALSTAILSRSNILEPSSVKGVSSTLDYDLGIYNTQSKIGGDNLNNYLTLNNVLSWKESHLNINGSVYGVGTEYQRNELYRVMYERDFQGYRFAAGLVDTWNLQSLGNISTINSSKIYGFSYGNKTSTQIENVSLSLTPITVFLPSAGEVHVSRQGRLLSIQNFPMGSFEIDTSKLPVGLYEVDIEVISDGKITSKTTQRVNKSFTHKSLGLKKVAWQFFGGAMTFNKFFNENKQVRDKKYHTDYDKKETYLAGASIATTLPALNGLALRSSTYGFDRNIVNESDISLELFSGLDLSIQTMFSNDSSWRLVKGITANIPGGFGSVWFNQEKSSLGDRLPTYNSNNHAYGGSLNVGRFIDGGGSLTISRTIDNHSHYNSLNIDYSTTLFSGKYGSIGLRTGIQKYKYLNNHDGVNQKYISLDFSLPLGNWLNLGVSNQYGNTTANIDVNKSFQNGVISSAGFSTSQVIQGNKNNSLSTNGYANFGGKYSEGSLVVGHPAPDQWNSNLTARGTLAYSDQMFGISGKQKQSGVIVRTDITGRGNMVARINGQYYPLSGKTNFIPLSPYETYSIELMNDKKSMDSFDIVKGKVNRTTLYPGNVEVFRPTIKQLVTVFGRVRMESGIIAANADIHNHIGRARTDANGDFSMDIDKRYPIITLTTLDHKVCETELNLKDARGVFWAGEIICNQQDLIAANKSRSDKPS